MLPPESDIINLANDSSESVSNPEKVAPRPLPTTASKSINKPEKVAPRPRPITASIQKSKPSAPTAGGTKDTTSADGIQVTKERQLVLQNTTVRFFF
jgi:hypothetical protein